MNRRLQQFLELENISPSRLADLLGIQRSGVSHILSGRNKPSFEFINRLLLKFPQVSADWLITGKGKPYKQTENLPSDDGTKEEEFTFDFNNNSDNEEVKTDFGVSYPSENPKNPVKRITLFFQNGSFEEFYPSK